MNYNRNIKVRCDNKEFHKLYDLFDYLANEVKIKDIYAFVDYPVTMPTTTTCNLDEYKLIPEGIKPFLNTDVTEEIKAVLKAHLVDVIEWDFSGTVGDVGDAVGLDSNTFLKLVFKWLHEK